MNSRWHSPVVEEILGASRAEPYLPQTGSEVVREVFLEEVEFTLRPEACIGFNQMIRGKICSKYRHKHGLNQQVREHDKFRH